MPRLRHWWLGPVLLSLACTPSRGEHATPSVGAKQGGEASQAPETPKTPETPKAPDESQWICERDEDCTQTCALGAVNAGWLEANPNADDCDDGCYWNHDRVRCRDGGCVTVDAEGNIDRTCTRRPRSSDD